MKTIYKFLFIPLLCALVACGDDDETPKPIDSEIPLDTESPKIKINSPTPDSAFMVISPVILHAKLTDNKGIKSASTFLFDAEGKQRITYGPLLYDDEWISVDYGSFFYPGDLAPGTYRLVVEAKDDAGNVSKDSVAIKVHAPDLNKETFTQFVEKNSLFARLDWGWFGFDYSNGIEITERELSAVMYTMINLDSYLTSTSLKEHEWEKFMRDFSIRNQSWSTWDEDDDGGLGHDELRNGLKRLDLFRKWNTNQDGVLQANEFASGIFEAWDHNRNNALSRAEYHNNFYYYLLSNR